MSVIVNIRGTGGSGKSTVVRRVMEAFDNRKPLSREGRKRPVGYQCWQGFAEEDDSQLYEALTYVPGHYETACGGCDTLKTVDEVFEAVVHESQSGQSVLFEGIMVGDDVRRTVELAQAGHRVVVIGLTTPLEDCLQSIRDRRAARGDHSVLDPKNTVSRAGRLERHYVRLRDGGCEVERLGREEAYARVGGLLG